MIRIILPMHARYGGIKTGTWISVLLFTYNRMELGSQGWRDAFFLRYRVELPYFPYRSDWCRNIFPIDHMLDYKKVGLILTSNTDLRD